MNPANNIYEEQIKKTLDKLKQLENNKNNLTKKDYTKQKNDIYKQDKKEIKRLCKTNKEK